MARPSPGAERVVTVLEFLAARPDDRFSLSELARGCRLNKATAHALLTELTARGVLLRHPDEKRYSLGPRLIPVGQAARRGYNVADFASGVVRRLAATTGAHTMAVARDPTGDHADAVEEAGAPTTVTPRAGPGPPVAPGESLPYRWPLVPPLGAVFLAWADGPSVETWLARCPAGGSVQHALGALEATRQVGALVADGVPAWWRLAALLADRRVRVNSHSGRDAAGFDAEVREALADLARDPAVVPDITPDGTYRPAYVAAPAFDQEGRVALALVVGVARGRSLPGTELSALVAAVVSAADDLTAAVHGRKPSPPTPS